jgi:5-methyltetrahydropteroyltriglutamate--homocysteine methyltransferase
MPRFGLSSAHEPCHVRHEHECKVWRDVKLPAGKILIPNVVSHATDLVEHPELVADRIITFAELVGRENVMAGTDCGLARRPRPSANRLAKLRALRDGAANREQEVVELNSNVPVRGERNKKQTSRRKSLT